MALHVITASQRRGAEVAAVDLAAALGEQGNVVALTAGAQGNALDVEVLGTRPFGPATLRALRRAAARPGGSPVIAHGSKTLPASVAALAGRRIPLVYRNIGDPRAWSGRGARRWRAGRLLRRTDHVVAMWPEAAAALTALHGIRPERITTIPNGVPAERFPVPDPAARTAARRQLGLPADSAVPVVACIGALSPEKEVATAIRAVAELDDVHLLVAGDGPDRAALEDQARDAAPGRIHFAGVLPGSQGVLAAADALLLTSRTEGLPGVLLEAGLSGRPAVASRVGGVGEIVSDELTGVLVEPGDVAGFAAGLRRVLADPGAMGAAARKHCLANFEITVVAAQWATLLQRLRSTS